MGKNLVTQVLTGSGTFTVPAGVTSITVFSKFKLLQLQSDTQVDTTMFAITASGQTYGWGANTFGKLGDNTIISKSSPVAVVGGYSFVQVSAGQQVSIGILADGKAYSWGSGSSGGLGDNTIISKSSPVAVVGGYSFVQVSAGVNGSIALTKDGQAYSWGANPFGVLGDNTIVRKSSPVAVVGGYSFVQVVMGKRNNTCLALTDTGSAYAWGYNISGQLGDNTTIDKSSPVAVVGGYSFVQIATGGQTAPFCAALTATGQAYTWGGNTVGQLGDNTIISKSSPVAVVGGYSFVQIALGSAHTLALDINGQVYAWGNNTDGQLGDGTVIRKSSPVAVVGGYSFVKIVAGVSQSYGFTATGQVYAWGSNSSGALGDNSATNKSSPVLVVGGYVFSQIGSTKFQYILPVTPGETIAFKTGLSPNFFGLLSFIEDVSEIVVQYSG